MVLSRNNRIKSAILKDDAPGYKINGERRGCGGVQFINPVDYFSILLCQFYINLNLIHLTAVFGVFFSYPVSWSLHAFIHKKAAYHRETSGPRCPPRARFSDVHSSPHCATPNSPGSCQLSAGATLGGAKGPPEVAHGPLRAPWLFREPSQASS